MIYADAIGGALDYIESHLTAELTLAQVAAHAGYSTYHFCHLFRQALGMPVAQYVTSRRLAHAIYGASRGLKLVDAALLYGFDTHAGFFKAFRREYGCAPSFYLKHARPNKPARPPWPREETHMDSTQAQLRQILARFGVAADTPIGDVWVAGDRFVTDDAWYVGAEYLLKSGTNFTGLRTHLMLAQALERGGMRAPSAVPTSDGEPFVTLDGRYYALLRRVPGAHLPAARRLSGDARATGAAYGEAIGRLHAALAAIDGELLVDEVDFFEQAREWALPGTIRVMQNAGMPLPDGFAEEYLARVKALGDVLPTQAIHREPYPSDILFENGRASGFLYFMATVRGARIYDPCCCSTALLSEAPLEQFEAWLELLRGILHGYDAVAHMTREEWAAIPYMILTIQFIYTAWLADKPELAAIGETDRNMTALVTANFGRIREICAR